MTAERVADDVLATNSRRRGQEFLTEIITDDIVGFLSVCMHLYVHVNFFESLFRYCMKRLISIH
jgi:hypothetical protein